MNREILDRAKSIFAKYQPTVLVAAGIVSLMPYCLLPKKKRRSNNWLKMHGYPMRRRGH